VHTRFIAHRSKTTHHSRSRTRGLRVAVLGVGLATALAACSSAASTRTASGGSSAAPSSGGSTASPSSAALPTTIPAGTTLRVGDQLDGLKNVLKLAGQDKNYPYKVEYSAFIGGPPMLQAFQAGALDTGFIGSTPLIFAQAAKQDLVGVAAWASPGGGYQLLASPSSGITGWASLKGKKVAFQQGTALEAALLTALDGVGLKLSDVKTVNLPTTSIAAALKSGDADAGISIEPLTSVALSTDSSLKVVANASLITDRSNFMIAANKTLDDPAKEAALADYIKRIATSYAYLQKHPDLVAKTTYVDTYHLPQARADELIKQNGVPSLIQLPGDVQAGQQKLADLFQANGEIPVKVDVAAEFDPRFNDIVKEAQGS
jgi:sulfonate transport system substrate-binding protein